jgi:hypothetical protein
LIGFGKEAVDSGLEIDSAFEDPVLKPLPGQFGEEALDGIEP